MKKTKIILAIIMLFMCPFVVNAEESDKKTDTTDNVEKIKVYMFRGEGCHVCKTALEFFSTLEKEYGKYYELEAYEVWNSQENSNLFEKVADYLEEEIEGVPFIVIGEKVFPGYMESWQSDIKNAIKEEYDKKPEERVDVVKNVLNGVEKEKPDKTMQSIIIVAVVVVFIGVICFARRERKK